MNTGRLAGLSCMQPLASVGSFEDGEEICNWCRFNICLRRRLVCAVIWRAERRWLCLVDNVIVECQLLGQ